MSKNDFAFFINSLESGGAERVVVNLANEIGDGIRLVTIWPNKFYTLNEDVNYSSLLSKKSKFIFFDLFFAFFKLVLLVKSEKIKSLNSHLFWANYINVFASFFSRHRSICTHCVSFKSKFKNRSFIKSVHYFLSKYLLVRSCSHTFKSLDMCEEYLSLFNFKNSSVIYNPIDLASVYSKSLLDVDMHDIDLLDSNYINGVCVGRFHPTKNQSSVLNLLKKLPDNYRIFFVGKVNDKVFFDKLVLSLGLTNRVFFLGEVTNPYPIINLCDFSISLSLSEGFPNFLVESIALSTVPFFYNCETGPKEILSSSKILNIEYESGKLFELGFLINNLSYNDIANDITQVLGLGYEVDDVARLKFLKNLDLEIISNKYLNVL
ncbi:glycosyltransferase [Shewanella sp. 10N.286.48.A6]|uniref:glycosyltransferase n=1 Tax=Shewanella sp. 10N.286.48.A6 TaxID=1880833 RepID=UPI000C83AA57|nr:glycosyltransferase [Shewanella sp. 10N.286.48.A6]PMI02836.1 hypothetical protein BCU55_04450 [Shewanella sp. 10N.286.48.A6]